MSLPYHPLYVQAYPQTSSQADVMPGGGVPSQTNEGPPSFYPSVLNPSQFQQQHQQQHQQQQPHIHQQQMQQMQQQQPHHLLHQAPHQNIQGQQPGQVASQTGLSALSLEVPSSESSVETHQYYQSMPMNAMPPTQTAYPLPGTISDRLQPLGLPRRPLVQKSQPTNQQQPQGYLPQLPPPVYPSHMQIPIEQISQPYQYASYPSVGYTPYINSNPSGYQYVQPFGVNQQFQRNFAKPTHLSENYIQSKRKMDKETTNTSASTSVSHFKPTKTKKNSKPRINKIQKAELASKKFDAKSSMASLEPIGEPSLDDLFEHFQLVLNIDIPPDSASGYYQLNLKNDLEHQLFDLFAHNLSNSIDIFLKHEVFKKVVPVLALHDETNMIMDSILCLSSLMLQRIRPDKIEPSIPIKYYHQCIKSIRYYLSIPGIENNEGIISRCLLSTILLCIYEMFFVAIDSTYVKGATSILLSIMSKHKQKNLLKESPFHEFCFLAVFVCDLILSLKFNSPSMYSIETFWRPLDNEYFQSFDNYFPQFTSNNDGSKDGIYPPAGMILSKQQKVWWAYKTFLNLSSINDFNNEVQVITREDFEMNKPFQKWLELRTLIDEFELYLPIALKPIIYKPSGKDRVLPIIYFNDELTAIIGLNFKLLKLALYEALILRNNTEDAVVIQELQKYPANYCKKLCKDIIGIMKTYDGNTNVWANNIHTVRQVARYIADEPEVFEQFCALVDKIVAACHFKLQDNIV